MSPEFKPGVRVRRVGRELRKWRENLNLTNSEAATKVRWAPSKLSKVENAQQPIPGVDVLALAIVYGIAEPERDRVFRAALSAGDRGWWHDYGEDALAATARDFVELEAEATVLRTFKPDLVPGLLQTERYATELARATIPRPAEVVVGRRMRVRAARQARLTDENPLTIDAVIWEAALRQTVGGPAVMAAQLTALAELATRPNVTIRILRLGSGAYPAMGSSFEILSFAEARYGDVVYVEDLRNGLYLEEAADVEAYNLNFESLREAAYDPDQSAKLLAKLAKELVTGRER